MAHIVSVKIESLNGRVDPVLLDFDRNTNILFGVNGSGKTSILKILHSAMLNDAEYVKNIRFDSAEVKIFSIKYNVEITKKLVRGKRSRIAKKRKDPILEEMNFNFRREALEVVRTVPNESWIIVPAPSDSEIKSSKWAHEYLPTSRLYTAGREFFYYPSEPEGRQFSEESLDARFATATQQAWSLRYGEIIQNVQSIQQEGLKSILSEILSSNINSNSTEDFSNNIAPDKAFDRVSSFLKRQSSAKPHKSIGTQREFYKRYEGDPQLRKIISYIDAIENEIDAAISPTTHISEMIKRLFSYDKEVTFDGPRIYVRLGNGEPIGLENLSSGEKQLMCIFLASIEAEQNSILIDEPELSMHIDWQKELVENIRILNPHCQLIIATHSPEIMADVADENIYKL